MGGYDVQNASCADRWHEGALAYVHAKSAADQLLNPSTEEAAAAASVPLGREITLNVVHVYFH